MGQDEAGSISNVNDGAGGRTPGVAAVLLVCAAAIFADVAVSGAIVPNIPVFAERFGASEFSLGLATSMFSVLFLAAVIPFGLVVDRTGRSDLIVVGAMGAVAVASLLFGFGNGLWSYALGQAFHGVGSAGAWVGAQPVAARVVAGRPRGGILMSAVTLALGLGLVFGPLVGSLSPVWLPFVILAAVALGVAVAGRWVLAGITAEPEVLSGMYRQLLRNPAILVASALVMLLYMAISMTEILFPLYADELGASKAAIGLVWLLYAVFLVAGQPAVAPILERIRRGSLETGTLVVMAAVLPFLVLTGDYGWWIAIFAVLGVATGVLISGSMLIIAAESPPSARGGAFALWNMAFAFGFLIGPPLGGALSQLAGDGDSVERFRLPFFAFAAVLLAAAPFVWVALRPRRASSATEAAPAD